MNPPAVNTAPPALVPPTTSTQPTIMEATAEVKEVPKPPPRIYDIYSWRQKAPHTRMVYIRNPAIVDEEIAKFKPGITGFDLEWKPTFVKGKPENRVALVQLANEDTVLLIQVTAMKQFPESLKELLLNPSYVKAGVGIQNDTKKLWADYHVSTRNCIDLSLLARTVDNAHWKGKYTNPIGLARLCETYEDLTLTKGKVTRSNWEANLTYQQQEYAANDCHSGFTLLKRLLGMARAMDPIPLPIYYSFDLYEGYLYQPSTAPRPEILWQPVNPLYDPGPPPPPKPAKEKKPSEDGSSQAGAQAEGSSTSAGIGEATSRKRLPSSEGLADAPRPRGGRGRVPDNQLLRGHASAFHSQPAVHTGLAPAANVGGESGRGGRGGRSRRARRGPRAAPHDGSA